MFSYTISMEPDDTIFMNACALIDSKVSVKEKKKLLVDVDDSLIQAYDIQDGRIKIMSDYDVYAVYIDSDIDLGQILTEFAEDYGISLWVKT